MLRHTGEKRTYAHNLRLAALLCITAGMVNICGLLGFLVLTTNVTGHAAVFAEQLSRQDYHAATVVGLWMLLFLCGAFLTAFYIRKTGRDGRMAYTMPIIAEIIILVIVGTLGHEYDRTTTETEFFAGSLLFAMGMQNAMVTMISGSVVRTTHLTGMFTDLGIDLAALTDRDQHRHELNNRILLRVVIISCFVCGGVAGGYLFRYLGYHTFYCPVGFLLVVMFYDFFRVRARKLLRNTNS
jgi:uncharacterized membrane protein YoaK (UPF0700 family)